ncbi:cytochrome P450 [Guyanagaster necrorhizus]|uniref:Cytochrome P450 n=1 Tax=Guyanagaster necrorhizus TaxID=856835 RepID=A0A9P7VEN3_9AGAR|nr:cytochrome P450 [Guyanagaster necrorhizus MCA 3950]KAG7439314.1 cytochrome P450 [Guyanagaster necrorhizus MCA 3950]
MNFILLLAFLSFCALLLYLLSVSFNRRRPPLPPGPKGLPFIGNLWDVPQAEDYPWRTYARWAATYGDILYLDIPGNPTVVVNSVKAAADLLEKRSRNYSDRPDFTMLNLMGWGSMMGFMRYSNWWRMHRRMFQQYFQPRALPAYYPVQMKATLVLLQQLYKSPDAFVHHIRHHSGYTIMRTVYGYDVDPNGDRFVGLVDRALESVRIAGNFGDFLVDYIPTLKYLPRWLPGAEFIRLAQAWRKDVDDMSEKPFEYTRESMAKGLAPPSFVSENLTKMQKIEVADTPMHLEIIRNTAAVAFAAGADTTVIVILSTVLAFLLYPEVQAKAQAELDAVVGHGTRQPIFDDRPQLPYIDAIVLEAMRWNSVLPLGIAHRTVKEDVYRGYYIPAGATIIGNAWAMLHNEKDYPNPLVFDPDRFIPRDGKERQPEPTVVFGFGRRICPGRYIAVNTAWIAIASMVSTLSFTKAVDSEPSETFTSAVFSFPVPFKCTIKARSPQTQALLD